MAKAATTPIPLPEGLKDQPIHSVKDPFFEQVLPLLAAALAEVGIKARRVKKEERGYSYGEQENGVIVTRNGITVAALCDFRNGNGAWNRSSRFTGEVYYTFPQAGSTYQRTRPKKLKTIEGFAADAIDALNRQEVQLDGDQKREADLTKLKVNLTAMGFTEKQVNREGFGKVAAKVRVNLGSGLPSILFGLNAQGRMEATQLDFPNLYCSMDPNAAVALARDFERLTAKVQK